MTPLEIILLSVCTVLFITCLGLAILYRRTVEDSIRLEWFVRKEARVFLRSGFLRWQTDTGFRYRNLDGMGYRSIIDRARVVTP